MYVLKFIETYLHCDTEQHWQCQEVVEFVVFVYELQRYTLQDLLKQNHNQWQVHDVEVYQLDHDREIVLGPCTWH